MTSLLLTLLAGMIMQMEYLVLDYLEIVSEVFRYRNLFIFLPSVFSSVNQIHESISIILMVFLFDSLH